MGMDEALETMMEIIGSQQKEANQPIESVEEMRTQLVDLMEATSEAEWSSTWMVGLDRILHRRKGLWEIMGRSVGWPVDVAERGTDIRWVTWEQADDMYSKAGTAHELKSALADLPEPEPLKDCGA